MVLSTCLVLEHQLTLLLLAAIVCASGAFVTMTLFVRSRSFDGRARIGWLFLAAISTGISTWTTHFVAMLGYRPDVPATFDPLLTVLSTLVAIAGSGIALALAGRVPTRMRTLAGGAMLGVSITGMHYLGMFGYQVPGVLHWDGFAAALSLAASIAFSTGALWTLRGSAGLRREALAAGLLALGIITLHLFGMQALTLTPIASETTAAGVGSTGMALAIAIVALLIVGTGLSTSIIDMDERTRADRSLLDMAYRDPLTGLPNRRALQLKMDQALAEGRWFKLMMIDLDHFKSINDTYGHATGDKLLCEVSRRFQASMGPGTYGYRIGGDELAALVFDNPESAAQMAHEFGAALREPMDIDGRQILSGCSIGICSIENAEDAETITRRADAALYEAKRRGRGQVVRFTPGMREADRQRAQLESDLQSAVERDEFRLHFQPIVNPETLSIFGYEALLRWTHPMRGPVSPAEFIPLAEASGAIGPIGEWVLKDACLKASAWPSDLYVAVNVSALQLRSARFPALVARILAETGLPPQRLTIELTETAIVANHDEVAAILNAVRALGVRVAMDDFGTGFSSLSHLRRLPVDVIKIDRSFVTSAEIDRNSMAVLKGIAQMGRDMEIAIVGEGVETPAQRDILRRIGCDGAQGYLFGKPTPFVLPTTPMLARAV
ncbi:putative bifunctional diguanylate cyclase/phosphodiesterase [Aureimonas phyllosphaerae]|uniref:Diguanylate cyclase (GGDEF)-like protein n=1 Tax=Aureimonas phyllosphaerae TaxID=1166078 RepID=A0A7W6FWB1_9HYPH|nr:EAL domain-containing protein [Aureimonas phyllosphaerae]MBB3936872.1 diguanylate cyclase (GGDEF)-like protein [Aureimonas phyllosphaerae]MBB3961013.1 diguanylate cyclase (GGDEF)-like protein [Aureimonas phyllosphaerae]SFF26899.1 diguanylate cyclase/phosphodiesterase [Aureimonas phyllosphaerae]